MPISVLPGSNEPSVSNPPVVPNIANLKKKRISWKNIVIGVIVGTVLIGGVLGGWFWYQLNQINKASSNSSTQTTTNKTASPSAKKATSSANLNETAGWKTLTTVTRESNSEIYEHTSTINFSFKYPSNYKIINDDGVMIVTNDQNYQLQLKTVGAIAAFGRISGVEEKSKLSLSTSTTLGGTKALRGTTNADNNSAVSYYVESIKTKEGNNVDFLFECNYLPRPGVEAVSTCDLMASTFKFL